MHALEIPIQKFSEIYHAHPPVFFLDVREPWEVKKVSLKGGVNMPLSQISVRQKELPLDQVIYVLCHHGVRSLKVAHFLSEQGYQASSVQGGIDAWARSVDASIGFY